jgi:hypothetical protein
MPKETRSIGEPLQKDELKGQNGYVDRISSGLTTWDVLKLMLKRGRAGLVVFAFFILVFPLMMLPIDPIGALVIAGFMLFMFGFIGSVLVIALLCTGKSAANMLIENNYTLIMKDRIVIQSQSDMMTIVLRNEVPLSKIASVEPAPASYIKDRKARTNICMRFLTGMYLPPIGGLYPIASRRENLMVLHLKKPHEIHCSGRNPNGITQFGDKREYVKEIIISMDHASQAQFVSNFARGCSIM